MELTQDEWLVAVASASNKHELLEFVRVYVSAHAIDLRLVPARCRPGELRDLRALTDAALALSQASLASVGSANEALDRFARFFGAAAQRAAALSCVAPRRPQARVDVEREE